MKKRIWQNAGGKATAIKLRAASHERYYANPNRCLRCCNIIPIGPDGKAAHARVKKFCDHSCSASFNNGAKPTKPLGPMVIDCALCKQPFTFTKRYSGAKHRRYCDPCFPMAAAITRGHHPLTLACTKADIFKRRKTWLSAATAIRRHAVATFLATGQELVCVVCEYDKHAEVCHLKPVSDFDPSATLAEMNHPSNLIALCPNHHWELDNGLLPEWLPIWDSNPGPERNERPELTPAPIGVK